MFSALTLIAKYPERLLVYHAGTLKVVVIGCLKINTIFLFSFSCLVLAPSYYLSPDWSNWTLLPGKLALAGDIIDLVVTKTASVIFGGAIPMIFVTYTTAPFVSYVHIKLPAFARRSQDQLMQWVKNLPRNTEIDMTTLRFSGRPRVSRMPLSDLKETKARLGVANLARVSNSSINSKRPWWKGKEPDLFYVAHDSTKGRKSAVWQTAPWQKAVWQHIVEQIRKQ